ncbi:hypothetical protein B0H16DRAFT_1571440 [Mycena metata]|uniref:Uncharacterized protein n=1 Tax=Mycena metata TaxID=1033252 RepID=A0AAD7I8W7_9AGAR|nr:hypothetical protein B0H16DRAFT_1571440 [Mycena metata]
MHQSHNIAWESPLSNLIIIRENPAVTPRRTDLFPRDLPSQEKSLTHFTRTLVAAIKTFSETERAKYASPSDATLYPPTQANWSWALYMYLFYNVLLSYPELHADNQYHNYQYQSLGCFHQLLSMQMAFEHWAEKRRIEWGPYQTQEPDTTIRPLSDINALYAHLKKWFCMLVDWEAEVISTVGFLWRFKTEFGSTDGQGDWTARFV